MAHSDTNSTIWREVGKPYLQVFPHLEKVGGKPGFQEFPHKNRLSAKVGGKPEIKEIPHQKKVGGKPTYYVREKRGLPSRPFSSPSVNAKRPDTRKQKSHGSHTMDRITITLPYPPSVNHYWKSRVVRKGTRFVPSVYVSDVGQEYQRTVVRVLDGVPQFVGPLRVQMLVQPPDGRSRDLDNVLKCLLDSLTKAGVWSDDSQVASLLVVRGDQVTGGAVIVMVEPVQQTEVA